MGEAFNTLLSFAKNVPIFIAGLVFCIFLLNTFSKTTQALQDNYQNKENIQVSRSDNEAYEAEYFTVSRDDVINEILYSPDTWETYNLTINEQGNPKIEWETGKYEIYVDGVKIPSEKLERIKEKKSGYIDSLKDYIVLDADEYKKEFKYQDGHNKNLKTDTDGDYYLDDIKVVVGVKYTKVH